MMRRNLDRLIAHVGGGRGCRRKLATAFVSAGLALNSSCAMFNFAPPDQQVRERANQWLTALRQSDYATAYSYTTKGYQSSHTISQYSSKFAGVGWWTDAYVDAVDCGDNPDSTRCEVLLQVTYRMPRGKMQNTRPLEYVWVRQDNGAWAVFHD